MQAVLGSDVAATLIAPSTLPAAAMGARIEVPVTRAIVAYYRLAAYDAVAGRWGVVLDSPVAVGEYNLVWRTNDAEPPEMEVFIPLSVIPATGGTSTIIIDPDDLPDWAPTLEDIAPLVPAYTRGGFDDDDEDAGAEQVHFTEDTSPTATHVEALILAACEEVAGRVGIGFTASRHSLAKAAAKWHVVATIAGGKRPAGTDDASGEYRTAIANFRAALDELVLRARADAGSSRLR